METCCGYCGGPTEYEEAAVCDACYGEANDPIQDEWDDPACPTCGSQWCAGGRRGCS